MNYLDYYMLKEISKHLPYPDYLNFIGTCKRFYELKYIGRKVEYLEELHKEDNIFKHFKLSSFISFKGHMDVIKYINSNNVKFSPYEMGCAAGHGHLDVVIWLHKNRIEECTKWAMNYAAAYGH